MESVYSFLESIQFLAICIVCISGYTGFLFYRRIKGFENLNPPPKIHYIVPKEFTAKRGPAIPIKTGILIEDFLEFSLLANRFVIDLRVWFIFNPSLIDLETVSQFSFDKGEILNKSEADTKFIGDLLFVEYKIRLKFSSNLDFHAFPVDDHRLYITLKNEAATPEEMLFDVSETGFRLSEKIYFSEWTIFDSGVEAGYQEEQLHKHIKESTVAFPAAVFFVDFSRNGIRKALIIVLPIIFIFFVGFSSLSFLKKGDLSFVIYVNTGSITGLLAYRFVVESISPDVGYFTLTDYIFTLFLTLSFVTFLVSAFLLINESVTSSMRIVNASFLILTPAIILFFMYFIITKHARKKF